MLPEQRGLLAGLFSRLRGEPRKSRRVGGHLHGSGRRTSVEELEARRLMVTRVWLDFGNGYTAPTTGPYAGLGTLQGLTNDGIHDALVPGSATPAVPGNVIYEEELGTLMLNNVTPPPNPYNLVGLNSYIGSSLDPTPVPMDTLTLEESITAQIQRALEPYDIQVISSFNSNIVNFGVNGLTTPASGSTDLSNVATLDALNDTGQQFGKNDIFISFSGVFQTNQTTMQADPSNVPISADFAVQSPVTPGAKPSRLDTGAIIDVNYWVNRVLGAGGTGGSLNVALANAAMYAIGWDFGMPEVENGSAGPFSNFIDPNVGLINQSNAMVEGGLFEAIGAAQVISDQIPASFNNFPMMQDGENFAPMLTPGTLGQAALLGTPQFPLPPQDQVFNLSGDGVTISETVPAGFSPFVFPDALFNEDPGVTFNSYQFLANDPDVGPNPDVAYVSGTGAADQIFITKIDATHAQVTVKSFTDDSHTTLISDVDPNVISTYSYVINLSKIVTPGRLNDNLPFKIIVDGTSSNDQVFLDPTLGVEVQVHGDASVKTLNIVGNGVYNVQYTPLAPQANNFQGQIAAIAGLIPEGLLPGGAGTLVITGASPTTVITKVGKKTKTVTTNTPFTTTVLLDHFNIIPDPLTNEVSALRLTNFNKLTYVSPGFADSDYNVGDVVDATNNSLWWQISGQVNNTGVLPDQLTGNLQFQNISQLVIDTSKGSSNDTVSFATGDATPDGLKNVDVIFGAQLGGGQDELDFDDSLAADGTPNLNNQTYLISATQLLPVQPANSLFTGFNFSGVEFLSLVGTQGTDQFIVTPNATTSYDITGTSGNDTLAVHLAGTQYSETDDGAGNGTWTFTHPKAPTTTTISFTGMANIVNQGADSVSNPVPDNTSPVYAGSEDSDIIALAGSSDSGVSKPLVQVYSAITNQLLYSFYAYEQTFKGGVRITTADVTGDGVPDVIVAPGAGRVGEVRVYDGSILASLPKILGFIADPSSALIAQLFPFGTGYTGGMNLAAADVDGDANHTPDLIVSQSKGTSQVAVLINQGSGVFTPGGTFTPYVRNISGVVVAAGDLDGDGTAEIVTAPGVGKVAQVNEYEYNGGAFTPIRQFNGFETTFHGGVSLTVADLDADGSDEIILGAGTGGKSRVRVFSAAGTLEREFQAYTTGNINAPVKILARNVDGSGAAELFTTQAISSVTHTVNLYDPLATVDPLATPLTAPLVDLLMESNSDLKAGISLG